MATAKEINAITGVIGGILLIFGLSMYPVTFVGERYVSIPTFISICNSPLGLMMDGGSTCYQWEIIYYGGWALGIFFIIFGVMKYLKNK